MTRTRGLLVAAAVVQLAVFGFWFAARLAVWHRDGWTGVVWVPKLEAPPVLAEMTGAVLAVAPGSPAEAAGMRPGDVVLTIDGVPSSASDALRVLARDRRRGDRIVVDALTRDEARTFEMVLESPLDRLSSVLGLTASFAVGVAFLGAGARGVWRHPGSRSAKVLHLLCATGATLFLLRAASRLDVPDLRGIEPLGLGLPVVVAGSVYAVVILLAHNLLLHFFLVFPAPRPVVSRWPSLFRWVHSAPFVPLAALALAAGSLSSLGHPSGLRAWSVGSLAITAAALAGLIAGAFRSGWKATVRERPFLVQALVIAPMGLAGPLAPHLPEAVVAVAAAVVLLIAGLALVVVPLTYSALAFGAWYKSWRETRGEDRRRLLRPIWAIVIAAVPLIVAPLLQATLRQGVLVETSRLAGELVQVLVPFALAAAVSWFEDPCRAAPDASSSALHSPTTGDPT